MVFHYFEEGTGWARQKQQHHNAVSFWGYLLMALSLCLAFSTPLCRAGAENHRNAYATMMYMGTPRDYEFYVAIHVLLKSLAALNVDADLVVIASVDVPA
ncbi:hypothetical protein K1719_035138 [Acacia pycnantha]|nr:hypothetical protein K1719_035138 [Acacia pycnantha]